MIKILFVCHGNICRSPMAEFVFKDMVKKAGLEKQFEIESAATSTEEIGNSIHPGTRRKLESEKIECTGHRAIQMIKSDYDYFDLLIGMDKYNIRNMERIAGGDKDGKIKLMLSFCNLTRDVADPWYTGDFDTTYDDIVAGCRALLNTLTNKQKNR